MNKLELKEIVGYLPYGLKVKLDIDNIFIDIEKKPIGTFDGINNMLESYFLLIKENEYAYPIINCKPILQPLSNFESENIDDIKEYLGIGQWCVHYEDYFDAWFDDAENIDKLVLQAPYEIMEFFFLNHYDVFGLIEKGLAIAVTEDFNPYSK
jgi:hypothetical protein